LFRTRRIYDSRTQTNVSAIEQALAILRSHFAPMSSTGDIDLGGIVDNPRRHGYRHILLVAESRKREVIGAALVSIEERLRFAYLDYIASKRGTISGGVGTALYERVREEALAHETRGLFLECTPDTLSGGQQKQNKSRLRFYERFGARPIENTLFDEARSDNSSWFLVYDSLGISRKLKQRFIRTVARAILERKNASTCSPEYVDRIVASFKDDPVQLREPHYVSEPSSPPLPKKISVDKRIPLIVNDKHQIHHVRDKGYEESPVRIGSILKTLLKSELFVETPPKHFPDKHVKAVHDEQYLGYLKRVCEDLSGQAFYPEVFPIRNATRPPKPVAAQAGYFCIDTFTPLDKNAYLAARRAVDCALTASEHLLSGGRLSYALVRPPGHHAERAVFGGFCYLNSSAVAAHYLSEHSKVAILDIDYHHGNGQQDIFYDRRDVFTVSIHSSPELDYPYFSGFADEKGEGRGIGFDLNYPLKQGIDGESYRKTLKRALAEIKKFQPGYLVLALGFDTARGDPTGTWLLTQKDFAENGQLIGALDIPTVVVQEGGYRNRSLGSNASHFFRGLWKGHYDEAH